MFEVLMGVMGGRRRWRTMPWMVAAFGIVVVPLGAVSIYFITIQPIVIGTYCTLCILAALAMLIMIPFTLDELVAMGQFLVQSHHRGERFLRTFFKGGASPGSGQNRRAMAEVGRPLRFINVACGAWLVVAPWVLEGESALAAVVSVATGAGIALLSLPRGRRSSEHYGSWDRYIV